MTNETETEASFDREWEDVSLRRYVRVLVIWWREIGLGAVLSAVGSGALILAMQVILPKYEASSDVMIVHTTSNVALDEKFSTGATLKERPRSVNATFNEVTAKRAAFLGLVESGSVAQLVTEQLSGKLDEEEANAARLIKRIDAELIAVGTLSERNPSNLIRITASADSPEKAVLIANTWAEKYVSHVNGLYRSMPVTQLGEVVAEGKRTKAALDAAQRKLETFITDDRVGQLELRIRAKRDLIAKLYDFWRESVDASMEPLLLNQENISERVGFLANSQREMMEETYRTQNRLKRLLDNAENLRVQIKNAGPAGVPSNGLALLMLKSQVYVPSARLLGALEVKFDDIIGANANATDQLTDVDVLIAVLKRWIKETNTMIQGVSAAMYAGVDGSEAVDLVGVHGVGVHGVGGKKILARLSSLEDSETLFSVSGSNSRLAQLVSKLEREIQLLKAKVENAKADLAVLIQDRDAHRSALSTLQNEIVELKLAMSAVTSEVRLASHALVPVKSAYPSARLVSVLGGIAGLLVSICLVFYVNAEGVRPLFEKRLAARSDRNRDAG